MLASNGASCAGGVFAVELADRCYSKHELQVVLVSDSATTMLALHEVAKSSILGVSCQGLRPSRGDPLELLQVRPAVPCYL